MADTLERVQQAKNPQVALAIIATSLDELHDKLDKLQTNQLDPWGEIAWAEPVPGADDALIGDLYEQMETASPVTITETEDETILEFKPPTEEKMALRRAFEKEFLKIAESLGGQADPSVDYNDVYAKAGPVWLYQNRDLFMSYAPEVRAAMCQEVIEEDHEQGLAMSRDALKEGCATGPGSVGMATDTAPQGKRIYVGD